MSDTDATWTLELPPNFRQLILLVAASKGGSGKSTLVIQLAVTAELAGLRTLIIDADDDQHSCVQWARVREASAPTVKSCATARVMEAIRWGKGRGYDLIIIDTAGRESAHLPAILQEADFMLTPVMPSRLDLLATNPIRRLARVVNTPSAVVLNGVTRENATRTRGYIDRFSTSGAVLKSVVVRRVQYVDCLETGRGVAEYRPGSNGDFEMKRLLREIFEAVAKSRSDHEAEN